MLVDGPPANGPGPAAPDASPASQEPTDRAAPEPGRPETPASNEPAPPNGPAEPAPIRPTEPASSDGRAPPNGSAPIPEESAHKTTSGAATDPPTAPSTSASPGISTTAATPNEPASDRSGPAPSSRTPGGRTSGDAPSGPAPLAPTEPAPAGPDGPSNEPPANEPPSQIKPSLTTPSGDPPSGNPPKVNTPDVNNAAENSPAASAAASAPPGAPTNSTSAAFREKPSQAPPNSVSMMHSLRRSERIRNQAARAEEQRLIREERAAIEEAKARARSIAAKKAAATKRKAAQEAEKKAAEATKARKTGAGTTPASAGAPAAENGAKAGAKAAAKPGAKKILKLKYLNVAQPPPLHAIELGDTPAALFWLRLNLRDFLYRFDKLCRLPSRLGTGINDPMQPYTPEQLKTVALALLKLIGNDAAPLHPRVRDYIAEIDNLDANNPAIWDWLLQFVEQLDAYAPQEVPTTEEEQLELLRRLMVVCTGTETIRITVTSDVDQLRWVEKDSADEIKAIQAKFKETEAKLAKLKPVDREVWADKVAAARRSADAKVAKSQQQLYAKQHKFNMRTAPLLTDPAGNRYWSFQYKSAMHADWGSWIVCEVVRRPGDVSRWNHALGRDVDRVLASRDELIAEKNQERKQRRVEAKRGDAQPPAASPSAPGSAPPAPAPALSESAPLAEPPSADSQEPKLEIKSEPAALAKAAGDQKPKRKYPKVKLVPLEPLKQPELYYVEGRQNILQLAQWLADFPGIDEKAVAEVVNVAQYLAQDV